ncbi:sodium:proton antiporter [Pseudoflavitalea sp. X16]|uniref:cation:proton antiporter domain-containing protein n=1 Tax=Paraflavitalea devenefica TaxID=2716334 RepID=UPI001420622B|nr:cation:proton antiporter [Paraflavitalea devenefica]NII27711.1 sodium:proton antiporter [Paraflavitalea devenefica]
MSHSKLIEDLALILAIAGVTTLLFKKLKQPVVLGYILAGLLVSPNFSLLPNVSDLEGVKDWAEIGIVFLLFSLGLEFSFKKLVKVGGIAGITGIFEVSCMIGLGYLTGRLMGWPTMDCIFLGGIIGISSTTIIIRAFDELGVKTQKFAGAVLGILVVEDLVAVLLMVLLSTIAVSQTFAGGEMLQSVMKLLFFLCLWFLSGIFLLPTFFKWAKRLINDETLLVISLGLCLLMVVVATRTGFSAPLGAFIMGSILAETTQAEKIEHIVKPVKDLFGAIFFVSVGLLIVPADLVKYAIPVGILTVVVILGKTVSVTIGSLISGQPLKQSLQVGMSLSQIGEFSFIIAKLGLALNVTSDYLNPVAVGVSVITAFTTPYMIKLADPMYHFLEKKLPLKWRTAINQYSTGAQTIQAESDWKVVLRSYLTVMLVNGVISVAIILLSERLLLPLIQNYANNGAASAIITCFITLIAIAPFLWALAIRRIHSFAYANLWLDKKYNHGPLVLLEVVRNLLLIVLVGFLVDRLFSAMIAVLAVLPVIVVVLLIFSRRLQSFYSRIEKRFLSNLHERENTAAQGSRDLSPWDAHLAYFTIPAESPVIGQTLLQLEWRERYGVNVASVERGKRTIYAPSRDVMIHPHDRIAVIGTDVQLETFRIVIEVESEEVDPTPHKDDIILNKLIVDNHTDLRGKSIRESGIREIAHGLVVGIERNGERILNPDSATVFEWDDVVWVVGERRLIQKLVKE